jgi:oligopeptide/dipeptide ABC transporter ATP-binding protein
MYAGKIVEEGTKNEVLIEPLHPYTEGLLNAAPRIDRDHEELRVIPGMVPNPANLPAGCAFRPRCAYAADICRQNPEKTVLLGARGVRCWKYTGARNEETWREKTRRGEAGGK